jgi:hypothetical protein
MRFKLEWRRADGEIHVCHLCGCAPDRDRESVVRMSEDVESKYNETIRELRCLENELGRKETTAESAISYIAERSAATTDGFAREDFALIAEELRRSERVDFAIGNTRETLARRYIDRGSAIMLLIVRPATLRRSVPGHATAEINRWNI